MSSSPSSATKPSKPGSQLTAMEMAEANGGDYQGKVFLVTGAYSGIGVETTKALLATKATVIVAGRNAKLQQEFVQDLEKLDYYQADRVDGGATLDLASLSSVKAFADHVLSSIPNWMVSFSMLSFSMLA